MSADWEEETGRTIWLALSASGTEWESPYPENAASDRRIIKWEEIIFPSAKATRCISS